VTNNFFKSCFENIILFVIITLKHNLRKMYAIQEMHEMVLKAAHSKNELMK
jgi:hypothetical protein